MNVGMIHHVSLTSRDLQKSRRFYSGVIGLKSIDRPAAPRRGLWFQIEEGQQLHLIEDNDSTFRPNMSIDTQGNHVAFRVEDYEKAKEHLKESGVEVIEQWTGDFVQLFCCDPDGHTIEFNAFKDPDRRQ
ncbi:VOC family protein [Halobacillus andaensis]|uniref:VOC family protein n=1 Tax=Halobacillus andaensis TaxID=1176239 RepID=UPI003D755515